MTPQTQPRELPKITEEWLRARVDVDALGHWIWRGTLTATGQPQARIGGRAGRVEYVRRLVLVSLNGVELTAEDWADVGCEVRACVRPGCCVTRKPGPKKGVPRAAAAREARQQRVAAAHFSAD